MPTLTRPAVLLTTASLAVGLLAAPSTAYAADSKIHGTPATSSSKAESSKAESSKAESSKAESSKAESSKVELTKAEMTKAEMTAAMKQVAAASTTAAAGGWKAVQQFTLTAPDGEKSTGSATSTVDVRHGLYRDTFRDDDLGSFSMIAADHRGVYLSVDRSFERAALRMMGRTGVTWVFNADKSLDLDEYVTDNSVTPAALAGEYSVAGTRTTHDDGSTDYGFTEKSGLKVTLSVTAAQVLAGARAEGRDSDGTTDVALTYTYGPQTITLPARDAVISGRAMATGVAYLSMADAVKSAAVAGARATERAAKNKKIKVKSLRSYVRKATADNEFDRVGMVKVKNIKGGVRVHATNPWTKQKVAYTVTATGRKAVVRKS
jgi:hypothetical protein